MYPVESIVCELDIFQNSDLQDPKNFEQTDKDPLDGLDVCNEETFYKLDKVVFADPINSINDLRKDSKSENKFTFLDKVTVEKRFGRRNKYHIEMEDYTKPICPEARCNKLFSSLTLLKAHIRKVHCAKQSFICEVCGSGFKAKYLLVRHMAVHERRKVRCPVCAMTLSQRTSLSVHMRFVHRRGSLKCDKCDQRFDKRIHFVRHKSSHQTNHV